MGLLMDHPGSGYDLMKRFRRSLGNVRVASQGQVYGELNRLADAGVIEATSEGPRGRQEYALTSPGEADLLRWLARTEGRKPQARFFHRPPAPVGGQGHTTPTTSRRLPSHCR